MGTLKLPKNNQFLLLKQNRFLPFFSSQFLGALNDNVFRNSFVTLITFQSISIFGINHIFLANIAAFLFILPFFLFSATAGQLADKYEKSLLMRRIKLLEIFLMSFAAFALFSQDYLLMLIVLFLMGCQSTLFSPVKYAYLPQKLSASELVGGNALISSGTYIAIIFGLIIGVESINFKSEHQFLLAFILVGISIIGYIVSQKIPHTEASDPNIKINLNIWKETLNIIRYSRKEKIVFISILGISWFWFVASAISIQMPAYAANIIKGNESIVTILLIAFAVGVGFGSLLCEKISNNKIQLGLAPVGSIGIGIFSIDLFFAQPQAASEVVRSISDFISHSQNWRIIIDLILIGACGGINSVPLYAIIQNKCRREYLSRVMAANNILNSLFMVIAVVFCIFLLKKHVSIPQLFLCVGVLNIFVAIYIYSLAPEFLIHLTKLFKKNK